MKNRWMSMGRSIARWLAKRKRDSVIQDLANKLFHKVSYKKQHDMDVLSPKEKQALRKALRQKREESKSTRVVFLHQLLCEVACLRDYRKVFLAAIPEVRQTRAGHRFHLLANAFELLRQLHCDERVTALCSSR